MLWSGKFFFLMISVFVNEFYFIAETMTSLDGTVYVHMIYYIPGSIFKWISYEVNIYL